MLLRLKKISGHECIKILCNKFKFEVIRQRGSHVVLKKETPEGRVGTVVPVHRQLKMPTLKNILKLAKVEEEEFAKFQ